MFKMRRFVKDIRVLIANCTVMTMMMMMIMIATKYESRLKTNTNSSNNFQEEEVCTKYKNSNGKLYSNDDDDVRNEI